MNAAAVETIRRALAFVSPLTIPPATRTTALENLDALVAEVVQLREALLEAQRLLVSGHQDSRREAQDVIAAAVSEETPNAGQ